MHDRDDKHEGSEDSEYHFSEDEANYELESEAPSQKPASPQPTSGSKFNFPPQYRRLVLGGVIFLVLILIVYKMVAPSATPPTTDISASSAPTTTTVKKSLYTKQTVQPPASTTTQTAQVVSTQTGAAPTNPILAIPAIPQQTMQAAMPQMPAGATGLTPETATTMPAVIPVQSAMPNASNLAAGSTSTNPTEVQSVNLQNQTERMMADMKADYTQKLNDFATQNKMLDDQVQSLNAKMATVEMQLNQLIKILTKHNPAGAPDVNTGPESSNSVGPAPEEKMLKTTSYSVQAIIPGRAWLRGESGETVTVAEGDSIRGLGKVTKIDPYDGIVEVSTGKKMISISYGSGG